ncbi:hypothetical protein EV658_1241 [Phaeovulum veldkampii DSM 11550]|nr:hypothetical protein EV658_1241 [Phaeovulum veldkampii DSM 11550]
MMLGIQDMLDVLNKERPGRWVDLIAEGIADLARELGKKTIPVPDAIEWLAEWAQDNAAGVLTSKARRTHRKRERVLLRHAAHRATDGNGLGIHIAAASSSGRFGGHAPGRPTSSFGPGTLVRPSPLQEGVPDFYVAALQVLQIGSSCRSLAHGERSNAQFPASAALQIRAVRVSFTSAQLLCVARVNFLSRKCAFRKAFALVSLPHGPPETAYFEPRPLRIGSRMRI